MIAKTIRIICMLPMIYMAMSCTNEEEIWIKPEVIKLGCDDYQSIEVDGKILYNNVWNKNAAGDYAWQQCIVEKPNSDTPIYGWSWQWPDTGQQIFAYPQIKVGTSPWAPLPVGGNDLPAKIKDINALNISHEMRFDTRGEFNVATSMWLTNSVDIGETQNKAVIAAEIMVWTYATEGHLNPAGEQIGTIESGGRQWSVWLDRNWSDASGENDNSWVYVTFKAEDNRLSNSFDVIDLLSNPILSDLQLDQYYIADVELGTEIMQGEGVAWVEDFSVQIDN